MNRKSGLPLVVVLLFVCMIRAYGAVPADRPNILWISLEDITPMMGCYGDEYARTPVFDSLAAEGIRYTKAHAIAPVCSVSRSSIITGMYPSSLGTMHHRSSARAPEFLKMLPNLLREAGYYTSNNAKQDYNMGGAAWHESSGRAHWRHRPDRTQPFFAVFNFTECHSSITKIPEDKIVEVRLNRLNREDFHDPKEAPIPPYHPDVPAFRKAWSRYYDSVTQVDHRAGEIIGQLKKDGLWEDTIVFVWADHGVGMPRGKHNAWEQGTSVPLIIRFPKKYQHLAPAGPGSVIDGLVTLMDLGPSALALADLEPPAYMHGKPLLCKGGGEIKYRDSIIGMRDRLDTRGEMVRSIRDSRYRYQRNFYPHLPFKPHEDFEFDAPVLKKWVQLAREGKLTGAQEMLAMRFKPVEELYDSENDPHMINNVIDDPRYANIVKRMRGQLHDWMLQTRDLGLLDETELTDRMRGNKSPWNLGQSLENYERILDTADLQLLGQQAIAALTLRCTDPDPAIRFWAVLGLAVITQTASPDVVVDLLPSLRKALQDDSVSVRLTAAAGLCNLRQYRDAVPVLSDALAHSSLSARIRSACILDSQPPEAAQALQPAIANLRTAAAKTTVRRLPGIPYGLNDPFGRALKAITGQENYYRWGPGASGSPEGPMVKPRELVLSAGGVHQTETNVAVEVPFRAEKDYVNPFLDVTLEVVFTDPAGIQKTVPGFWAGDNRWKVRYASPAVGVHRYRTQCSDVDDDGLHRIEGHIEIKPYTGNNSLLKHGFPRVAEDRRHFAYDDGTPFFWLGDTWWKCLCKRMTWEGFQELAADRKKKGFSVIQIVCGPYPDEGPFEPSWENEGGMPYKTRDFKELNSAYWDYADRRLKHLVDAELVPAIVGAWGRADCDAMRHVGIDGLKRHWRYLVARYGAYPVFWILGGELKNDAKWGVGSWGDVGRNVRRIDPYRHPLTVHSGGGRLGREGDDLIIDYDMVGGSHRQDVAIGSALGTFTSAYAKAPVMPTLVGETCYEGHMQQGFQYVQRHVFWMYMLSGAAGHTYGAAGIWHASVEGDPGCASSAFGGRKVYDWTTWREGMNYPGAVQVGIGKKLLEEYSWSRFEPHPEWAEKDCHAAGIPGEVRFIYQPRRTIYNWKGMVVKNLESDVPYSAFYFDPATGRRFDQGMVTVIPNRLTTGDYTAPNLPSPQDWVLVLEREK